MRSLIHLNSLSGEAANGHFHDTLDTPQHGTRAFVSAPTVTLHLAFSSVLMAF